MANKMWHERTQEEIEKIIELYQKGNSLKKVSELTNCGSVNTIKKILINNNVEIRDRSHWHKATIKYEDFFEIIDTEEKAYFLGFIMADGNITERKSQSCLRIEIHKKDVYVLEKFKESIGLSNEIKTTRKNHCKISLHSDKMVDDLAKYGVKPRKSCKEVFPSLESNFMAHFIRGHFDGDGWCTNTTSHGKRRGSRKQIGFCGGFEYLNDLVEYLNKNLNLFKLKVSSRERGSQNNFSQIVYSSKHDTNALINFMYKNATIYLDRKRKECDYIYANTEGS